MTRTAAHQMKNSRGETRQKEKTWNETSSEWIVANFRISYLRWGCDEIRYCMDNDGREASSRYPEEGSGQSIESHNNDYSSDDTCCRGSNTRSGLQSRTRKRASGGIRAEARTDSVCNTNSNKFLVGINFVTVQSPESYVRSA